MNQFVPFWVAGHSTAGWQGIFVHIGGCFVKKSVGIVKEERNQTMSRFSILITQISQQDIKCRTYCSGGSLTAAKFFDIWGTDS